MLFGISGMTSSVPERVEGGLYTHYPTQGSERPCTENNYNKIIFTVDLVFHKLFTHGTTIPLPKIKKLAQCTNHL